MKRWKAVLMGALLVAPAAFAGGKAEDVKDENKRLENAGTVMNEILNVPVCFEGSVCRRRQLRTRHDGLPHRQRFHGTVGRAGNVRARGRQRGISNRR